MARRMSQLRRIQDETPSLWEKSCLCPTRWDLCTGDCVALGILWHIVRRGKYRGDWIKASSITMIDGTKWISCAFSGERWLVWTREERPVTWCSIREVQANWIIISFFSWENNSLSGNVSTVSWIFRGKSCPGLLVLSMSWSFLRPGHSMQRSFINVRSWRAWKRPKGHQKVKPSWKI